MKCDILIKIGHLFRYICIDTNGMIITENIVKAALINHFATVYSKDFYVCNELMISSQNKIIDIVLNKDNLNYGFEIKAANDDFRRLRDQLDMYSRFFDYLYVVCSSNHINSTYSIPSHIGILEYTKNGKIVHRRKALRNKEFDIQEILASIPKYFLKEYLVNDVKLAILDKEVRHLFSRYVQYRSRWSKKDLQDTLHFEDILKNTEYIKLL